MQTMADVFGCYRMGLGRSTGVALLVASVAWAALPMPLLAQSSLRNTFPGRRIGGGTRGECSARVLGHLVPSTSVFAPGGTATIGVLEGPTAHPRPLMLSFRPLNAAGTAASAQAAITTRELPAAGPGVVVLTIPAPKTATVWESGYRCDNPSTAAGGDGLDYVQSASPPALSLLVTDVQAADRSVQAGLKQLRSLCGKTVATAALVQTFGISDVVTPDWPAQLPVRCP